MYPQERTNQHPVLESGPLKEPRGRSLILSLAPNVVICGRVWGRQPVLDVLFYLCPWAEDSVSTTDAIRVGDHKHFTSSTSRFTSSTLFDICCIATLVLSAPMQMSVECDVGGRPIGPRTILDLSRGLQNLSHHHLNFLLYQAIEPLQRVLNICLPYQFPGKDP